MVTVRSAAANGVRRVTVAGQDFRVHVRVGDGSGPRLLMCGGLGASLEILQPLVDALDPSIEVIRFDAPGVGGSPVARLPYSFPQLAWLVGRLLDRLGYSGQTDLLGYSWGGALAQQLALQRRMGYRRLVLISSSTGTWSVPGRPQVLKRMLTPHYVGVPGDAVVMSGRLEKDRGWAPSGGGTLARSGRGYYHQLAALAGWTSLPFLPMIMQPTLIVSGDDDPVVPIANARIMSSLIPRSTLHVFSGGHVGIITSAAEIGNRVSEFLI